MKIVILDGSAANPGDISWGALEKLGEVIAYDITSKDQLIERLKGAECAITNKTVFDKNVFENLPDLKYIGVLATGYNVVDLAAANAEPSLQDRPWCKCSPSVAENEGQG